MKLLNHVQIKVKHLKNSQSFYSSIMRTLGYLEVLHIKDTVIGYGVSVHDMFEIRQATDEVPVSESVHLAFNAPSLLAVKQFYKTALEQGGKCNGKPGFRPEYQKGYYAAFVTDINGHNIEAVYIE